MRRLPSRKRVEYSPFTRVPPETPFTGEDQALEHGFHVHAAGAHGVALVPAPHPTKVDGSSIRARHQWCVPARATAPSPAAPAYPSPSLSFPHFFTSPFSSAACVPASYPSPDALLFTLSHEQVVRHHRGHPLRQPWAAQDARRPGEPPRGAERDACVWYSLYRSVPGSRARPSCTSSVAVPATVL